MDRLGGQLKIKFDFEFPDSNRKKSFLEKLTFLYTVINKKKPDQ